MCIKKKKSPLFERLCERKRRSPAADIFMSSQTLSEDDDDGEEQGAVATQLRSIGDGGSFNKSSANELR